MRLYRMLAREMQHRKLSFGSGLLAVALAVASIVGALSLLKAHDLRTAELLEDKARETSARMAALQDEMRKAMLKLSFNLVILPKDQNLRDWYADDYAAKYMPEEYVERLSRSKIVTIQHLLPSLQQKVRWPEKNRTIILVGTRGEVPYLFVNPKKPLVDAVPPGTIVLGHELHRSMDLKKGDKVQFMGSEFVVHKCHEERGSKDDITAWISLREAQDLLGKQGLINAILALECVCAEAQVEVVRTELSKILPETQVIERGSEALARAEARIKARNECERIMEQERSARALLKAQLESAASVFVAVAVLACAVWIALLTFWNTRVRGAEIGILRAIGFRSCHVLLLFLGKSVVTGALGSVAGFYLGVLLAPRLVGALVAGPGGPVSAWDLLDPGVMPLALGFALFLSVVSAWIPALLAARRDPADILRSIG